MIFYCWKKNRIKKSIFYFSRINFLLFVFVTICYHEKRPIYRYHTEESEAKKSYFSKVMCKSKVHITIRNKKKTIILTDEHIILYMTLRQLCCYFVLSWTQNLTGSAIKTFAPNVMQNPKIIINYKLTYLQNILKTLFSSFNFSIAVCLEFAHQIYFCSI